MRDGTDYWQTKWRSLLHSSDGIVELVGEITLEVGWDCEELVYGTVRHAVMQKRVRYVSLNLAGCWSRQMYLHLSLLGDVRARAVQSLRPM